MKTLIIKIKTIIAILLVMLLINACTDNFETLNTHPGLVTKDLINPDLLLTRVEVDLFVKGSGGPGSAGNYCGLDVSDANRPFQTGDNPGLWNSTYNDYVRNSADIIHLTEDDPDMVNKHAIARIIKAYAFANLTDTYGDVPYFESALKLEQAVFQPRYDAQQDIYMDLFQELKEAAAELDADKASFGNADILYKGDVAKWRKLANSLRFRLALRVRYVDATLAKSQMSDLTLDNMISQADDDAFITRITDYPENENQAYVSMVNAKGDITKSYIGKTLLDLLVGTGDSHNPEDPRIGFYCDTAKADWPGSVDTVDYFGYRGHPLLGLVPVEEKYPYGSESCSRVPDFAYCPSVQVSVFRSSETYFSLAEAALVGLYGSPADAQMYYKQGIVEAMNQSLAEFEDLVPQIPEVCLLLHQGDPAGPWTEADVQDYIDYKTVSQAQVDDFLANAPVMTLTGDDTHKLEMIINQKIISIPTSLQGWSEKRRTGFPKVLVGHDNDDLKGKIPRRFQWPTSEQQVNSANFAIAVEKIGGKNEQSVKFWWDANPNYDANSQYPGEVLSQPTAWITTK